jgi:hypothetical protein
MAKDEEKFTFMESLLVLPVTIIGIALVTIMILPLAMLYTWIRLQLWGWFAVTYLHLPMIPFWAMYGLGLILVAYHSGKVKSSEYKPTTKDYAQIIFGEVGGMLMLWGIGYIVHTYLLH